MLGAHDLPDQLLIPEKLYGREREIDALLASFDRVVTSGTVEFVLVSGYSGIGKSSVVNEYTRRWFHHVACSRRVNLTSTSDEFQFGNEIDHELTIRTQRLAQVFSPPAKFGLRRAAIRFSPFKVRPDFRDGQLFTLNIHHAFPSFRVMLHGERSKLSAISSLIQTNNKYPSPVPPNFTTKNGFGFPKIRRGSAG